MYTLISMILYSSIISTPVSMTKNPIPAQLWYERALTAFSFFFSFSFPACQWRMSFRRHHDSGALKGGERKGNGRGWEEDQIKCVILACTWSPRPMGRPLHNIFALLLPPVSLPSPIFMVILIIPPLPIGSVVVVLYATIVDRYAYPNRS